MSGAAAAKSQEQKRTGRIDYRSGERSPQAPLPSAYADVLALQQSVGNQAVHGLVEGGIPPVVQSVISSGGQALEPGLRAQMESCFGQDFGQVRVHTDGRAADSAEAVSAKAYTVGRDVVFGQGRYAPDTSEGERLLAHELAHVVQQSRGGAAPNLNPHDSVEQAADQAAHDSLAGEGRVAVSGACSPGISREQDESADLPILLAADVDVAKLSPEHRQQLIESINRRLKYLDSQAQKAPQPGTELKFPGMQAPTIEMERARLLDWKKKLEEGTGVIVAPGIPRSSETQTPARASVQPAGQEQSQAGKGAAKPQAHSTPAGLGPKSGPRTLDDVIAASNVRPGSTPAPNKAADAAKSMPPLSDATIKSWLSPGSGAQPDAGKGAGTPQAHTTPPGLGPKPGPRTLEDAINAANVRPGTASAQNKALEAAKSSPRDVEAMKYLTPRKPGEVTLPGGQTVIIPPKPAGEITEDIMSGEFVLAKANVTGVRAVIVHNLKLDFDRLEYSATQGRWAADTFLNKWYVIRKSADIVAKAEPPSLAIWTNVENIVKQGLEAIRAGNLEEAVRLLIQGQEEFKKAQLAWYNYKEKNLGGAEDIAKGLEVTRDVSFTTLAVLATIASGGAAAPLANAIAFSAPLVAEAGKTALQVATGEKINWGEKVATMAVALIVQRYGGLASKRIVDGVMASPAAQGVERAVVQEIVQNLMLHEGSVALHTTAQGLAKSAQGGDITWDQFEDQLIDRLADPEGLAVATVSAAISGGAKSVYLARGGKITKLPPGERPEPQPMETKEEALPEGAHKVGTTTRPRTSRHSASKTLAEPPQPKGPIHEASFADFADDAALKNIPEAKGPVVGQKLGAVTPGEQPLPATAKPAIPETLLKKLKDVPDLQKKVFVQQMQTERTQAALEKLKDVPDLQKAAAADPRLTEMAENSPPELREHWKNYQAGRAKGTVKSPDFGDYVEICGRESGGTAGEYGETFGRGADEIVVKSPKLTPEGKAATTKPGTDMITYDSKGDRVKLLDNKAVKNPVGKVSALEKNLRKNLADDIADIKKYAGQKEVPPEIRQKVLPRMEAALKDLNVYMEAHPRENPYSQRTQKAFNQILRKHGIDRVVTFSSGSPRAGIRKGLRSKGFQTE